MNKLFTDIAWTDYLYWQTADKKILKKINDLLKDIDRNGNEGIGKPEPLKNELSGYWSRRITTEHRLIYKIDDGIINILQCRGHYD
jgi:toxin YoeB